MINYIKASNEKVGQHDQNAYTKYQTTKTRSSQAEHKSMALVKAFQHIYEFKKISFSHQGSISALRFCKLLQSNVI